MYRQTAGNTNIWLIAASYEFQEAASDIYSEYYVSILLLTSCKVMR